MLGYELLHQGARALARVESSGVRIDVAYLDNAIIDTEKKVADLEKQIVSDPIAVAWRRRFGSKTNLQSREQMGIVLSEHLELDLPTTSTGRAKTDESTLSTVDHPFVKSYFRIAKLKKLVSTYLKGIRREVTSDGYLHPFFNLHTTVTYRSSSDSPNFQNVPVRDPEAGTLIRRAFIPRKGRVLLETDYSGIEVRVAACYHKDPAMLRYIKDPSLDMHRDMASECYKLPLQEVNKAIRHAGKNQFVFPQFYGDWYIDCARMLWESAEKLSTVSGEPLRKHMAQVGIKRLGDCNPKQEPLPGTFENHIREVERNFWGKRFPVYARWKRSWYEQYQRQGFVRTLTGFVCRGFMARNDVINYPIQGDAFHCLLWSLIRLVLFEFVRRKFSALVVGQIHDSIVSDVPEKELDDVQEVTRDVMVTQLCKAWKWLIVPLDIEMAASASSWAEMKALD